MTTAPVHDTRFQALRQRLQGLRYHQPLGLESAPLCVPYVRFFWIAARADLEQTCRTAAAERQNHLENAKAWACSPGFVSRE